MDNKVFTVLNGFISLNDNQRGEFIDALNELLKGGRHGVSLESLQESVRKKEYGTTINFGPVPSGCPCCGR